MRFWDVTLIWTGPDHLAPATEIVVRNLRSVNARTARNAVFLIIPTSNYWRITSVRECGANQQ